MLPTTFIERLLLSLIHHFSKTFMLIICLCVTFSTSAKVAKVCHEIMRLSAFAINLTCVETYASRLLFQNDLVRKQQLDAVEMAELTGETGFSWISRVLSAQNHSSQNGILRLVKLNFDRSKLAISTLSSSP